MPAFVDRVSMTFQLTCVLIILVRFRLLSGHPLGNEFLFRSVFLLSIIGSSSQSFSMLISFIIVL